MSKLALFAFSLSLAAAVTLGAQTSDPNPAHSPDVFLDNHRPLVPKKDKAPTSRMLTGKVVDESGQPLEGAIVTLKNDKTGEKTTFFTKKDGRYRFEDLSFTHDYEVSARYRDMQSEPRKLSQYDHTADVVRILQVSSDSKESANSKK